MGAGSVAIIPAATVQSRNRDVEYPYRQASDLQYLTGFPEPEAVAVLLTGRGQAAYVLLCGQRAPGIDGWNGLRAGQAGAGRVFGADDWFPVSAIDDLLPGMMDVVERVF